jgi:hypothetical protein
MRSLTLADPVSRLASTASRVRLVLQRNSRAIRDALIVAGLVRAAYYFAVQEIRPWEFAGVDARAYWGIDLAHPYATSVVYHLSAFLYSPAFAQLFAPVSAIPFGLFFALWAAALTAIFVWLVRPWPWAGLILVLPVSYEILVGNVHFLLAAVVVLGFEYPGLWAFSILTKITPGIGLLWFLVRGEWRRLFAAAAVTAGVAVASFVLSPGAWFDWAAFLVRSAGSGEALALRVGAGVAIMVIAARTDRRWLVPVAIWIALPVVYINSWVLLLGTIRLARPRAVT